MKFFCYFLYVVCYPLGGKLPAFQIFLAAYLVSMLQRIVTMGAKDSVVSFVMSDEEAMHFMWFLTYVLMSWQMSIFVNFMFLIWAVLNTVEWFDYIIHKHPGVPVLPLLSGMIQTVQDNTI